MDEELPIDGGTRRSEVKSLGSHVAVLNALEDNAEAGSVVDVVEMYARRMGLVAGQALDLRTGWDFRLPRHKEAALRYVRKVRPKLVIGSPGLHRVQPVAEPVCLALGPTSERQIGGGAESHAVHRGGVLGTSQSWTLVFE